jgi:hypothetical protein
MLTLTTSLVVKVGGVYIAAKMAGMQNVDIANLEG